MSFVRFESIKFKSYPRAPTRDERLFQYRTIILNYYYNQTGSCQAAFCRRPPICLNIPMLKGAVAGFRGDTEAVLCPAFKVLGKDFTLSAFCEEAPELLLQAGKLLPGTKLFGDYSRLLAETRDLDFVFLRGPGAGRFEAALQAFERNLHVLCETPPCFSSSEYSRLREAADKNGRTFSTAQPWERSSAWMALERVITGGLLGRVLCAESQIFTKAPAPAGGITAAAGWQAFSMLLGLVRRPPSALAARLSPAPLPGAGAEDSRAAFQVHFGDADGAVCLCAGAHADRLRVSARGEKGAAELEGDTLRLDIEGVQPETVKFGESLCFGRSRPQWLAAELADFNREVKKELPAGAGLRNSRYCVKLLKNAYYSAALKSAAVPL